MQVLGRGEEVVQVLVAKEKKTASAGCAGGIDSRGCCVQWPAGKVREKKCRVGSGEKKCRGWFQGRMKWVGRGDCCRGNGRLLSCGGLAGSKGKMGRSAAVYC
ncbi:hypothetical protein MRB53_006182 [Persea americana]|uniref:Uncharacterized protein n=1 Tax=Persea americana TaxID=3435 RepID=A0ACC2MFN0_PERAE|nr:hypothetical protein MRB53_006182 [Persea americana]